MIRELGSGQVPPVSLSLRSVQAAGVKQIFRSGDFQSVCPYPTKGTPPPAVPAFPGSGRNVSQPLLGLVPIVLCLAVGTPANVPFLVSVCQWG